MRELWRRLGRANKVGVVGALMGFAAGMLAVVIADPVAGAVIVLACIALLLFCLWFFFHDELRNVRLRQRGTGAWATILAVHETGVTVQGNYPQAKLDLLVDPGDGDPYEATTKCLVNRFEIPAFQPGARIRVFIDPDDRRKVAVE
jgi:hypothetical protein